MVINTPKDSTGQHAGFDKKRTEAYVEKLRTIKFGGNKAEGYGNPTYSGNEWEPQTMGAIKRCVWTIPTKPFSEAHFATYPEELVETPIKAGCPVGGIVLDPFFGSGTTGLVAMKLGRDFVGVELNEEYIKIAKQRLFKGCEPLV
jgi:DNA modification methylase